MTRLAAPALRPLAAALAFGAAACGGDAASHGRVGDPAPAYSAVDLKGDSVRLADLRGQPVLLNVWATWCPPCREEIPVLQALHERHADDGLRVIGVSVDDAAAADVVRSFGRSFGMTYPIWLDPAQRVSSVFRLRGVPVTLLLGADGTVLWRHLGPVAAGDPTLRAALDSALVGGRALSTGSGT